MVCAYVIGTFTIYIQHSFLIAHISLTLILCGYFMDNMRFIKLENRYLLFEIYMISVIGFTF